LRLQLLHLVLLLLHPVQRVAAQPAVQQRERQFQVTLPRMPRMPRLKLLITPPMPVMRVKVVESRRNSTLRRALATA
jgi:hypothetical protein